MANTSIIKHRGIVEQVTPECIIVRIQVADACAACHAKSFCSISGMAEKRMGILPAVQVAPGEEVNVMLRSSAGWSAVGWAYVLPLAVLLAILVSLQWLSFSEVYSGAAAVGGVALYYGALYAFRKKWKKKYVFEIEKIK